MFDLTLEVFGEPASQGSHSVINGRIVQVNSAKHKRWRNAVAFAAMNLVGSDWELLDEAIKLSVIFYLPRPKTATRELPAVMPDLDKLIRSVGDSLTGTIIRDDSRIVIIQAQKIYADERGSGALIRVSSVENDA
jgi:Holliday junction resolvase RusA-like endonuclease